MPVIVPDGCGGEYIEIYFSDLTEEAKREFMRFMRIEHETEGNWECVPLGILMRPEDADA
uniref:Uncharacterized protein n=1 Tax=viral metagenome TaxID=1070528 RepID=A0A6H2A369_9ZZZZ